MMLLAKVNIYNNNLNTVTIQIINNDQSPAETSESNQDLLLSFIETLNKGVEKSKKSNLNFLLTEHQLQELFDSIHTNDANGNLTTCYMLSARAITEFKPVPQQNYGICITETSQLDTLPEFISTIQLPLQLANVLPPEKLTKLKSCALIVNDVYEYQNFTELKKKGIVNFQGDFIEKPQRIDQTNILASKISLLKLISTLTKPNEELDEAAQVIKSDNVLGYKLLQIVNSAIFRGMTELISIQEAIVRFGFANLKKWVLMLSLCSVSDKPLALVKIALIRAIMCSKLADNTSITTEIAYTAGLLSTLDAFIDSPIEILLEETALNDQTKNAIQSYEGELGHLLKEVIHYQRGDTSLQDKTLLSCYIESAKEAGEIFDVSGMNK